MSRLSLRNQLLVLEHDVLKAIATGQSLGEAMELLCRRVEALAGAAVCSVLRVEGKRLWPLAAPSLPDEYSAALAGASIGPKAGSCGTAAFRREEVDVRDIATDPLWDGFRDLILPFGLNSCWSSPIVDRDGQVIGTFAFYHRGREGPRGVERQIVRACVPLCAIAIDHERAQAEARWLAYRDPLTELANRAAFFERAGSLVAGAGPEVPVVLFYLDLDGFKEVNDTLGHWAGDQLLAAVGKRLTEFADAEGVVARLGGDEFAILRAGCDVASVEALGDRLMSVFAAPFKFQRLSATIRVSAGIAFRDAGDDDLTELMKNADLALYRAKAEGGARYCFFDRHLAAVAQRRRQIEADLRKAIDDGEFFVTYQPIVALATGEVTGCEALVRWRQPTGGLLMPGEFISIAEELGLIAPIGAWVLEEACRQAARWPGDIYVAVNLSAFQLRDQAFDQQVSAALAKSGLASSRLQLEITESVLLADNPVTAATLSRLREMGVVIALDDFGTGYSSLRAVRVFRPDKLKVDKSFVQELGDNGHSTMIVRAVIALARNLGMMTTAEGIETADQARILRAEGCIEGQGYHFSKPRPAGEIAPMLPRSAESRSHRLVAG